jgi:hypothetical protein
VYFGGGAAKVSAHPMEAKVMPVAFFSRCVEINYFVLGGSGSGVTSQVVDFSSVIMSWVNNGNGRA